jgi:hypothetical protein
MTNAYIETSHMKGVFQMLLHISSENSTIISSWVNKLKHRETMLSAQL